MENVKIMPGKLSLRELNLSHGGNNVRWLNEREDKLLQSSLNSLEKARERSISRIQHQVKGLHHTLRDHVKVRTVNPQLTNKLHVAENDEHAKRLTTLHTRSFNLPDECSENESDEETNSRSTAEDSKQEHMIMREIAYQTDTTSSCLEKAHQAQNGRAKKHSQSHHRSPTGQVLSTEQSTVPSVIVQGPRRTISVTDLPPWGETRSPRIRKTSVLAGEFHLTPDTALMRNNSRSSEMLDIPGNTPKNSLSPFLGRKNSRSSISRNSESGILFTSQKHPHNHQPVFASSPRMIRKISCPPKLSHQSSNQEALIRLSVNRNTHGNPSKHVAIGTDLPKLNSSHSALHAHSPDDSEGEAPDSTLSRLQDCTLQEKVNNFLRSLERELVAQGDQEETS